MKPKHLIPYAVILAAKGGDADAMQKILRHYDGLISHYSRRTSYDEYGNATIVVDPEIKSRIQSRLMFQIIYEFDPTRLPKGELLE